MLILDLLGQTIRYFLVVDYWFEVGVHQAIIITEDHWTWIASLEAVGNEARLRDDK